MAIVTEYLRWKIAFHALDHVAHEEYGKVCYGSFVMLIHARDYCRRRAGFAYKPGQNDE